MHIIEVTTCTPDGHHLHTATEASLATSRHALARAAELAATVTVDLHAQDPHAQHVHLIALNGDPVAVVPARASRAGRTHLLATLANLSQLHT